MLTEAARASIAEIYRQGDWKALTQMVDSLVGELAQQQARIAALEAKP